MQSHYEINVSLNGKHLFATHERSIITEDELLKVIPIFRKKFPKNEGFEVTVSYNKVEGTLLYRLDQNV